MRSRPGRSGIGSALIDLRQAVEVMAEVARGGEKGRPAIFVAAIAGDALRRRPSAASISRAVLVVEGEREEPQIVGAVLALAEPGADDDRGDRRLLEHPAGGDVGDRHAVLARDLASAREDALQDAQPPIASTKRLYFIVLQSAIARAGSGLPSHFSVRSPPASVP